MFREALDYPTRPPHGGRVVLVGGGLLLVVAALSVAGGLGWPYAILGALAFVPWLVVRGYYVRVVRATIGHEEPRPPDVGGYGELIADGARAVVVAVAYLLPAVAVLGPLGYARFAGVDLATVVATTVPASAVSGVLSALGVLAIFAFMYLLGALYAVPVAVARFAYVGRLRAAFDVRTVVAGATTEDYVVAWFVSLLLQLLVLPVAYLLRLLVVGFFLHFLVAVAVRYCYGQGVGHALDLEPVVPEPVVGPTVGTGELEPAVRRIDDAERDWREGERT